MGTAALLVAFAIAGGVPAHAVVHCVELDANTTTACPNLAFNTCDHFDASIQAAVNVGHAVSGDSVLVDAGAYAESVTVIDNSLASLFIRGCQAGVDARSPRGAESVIDDGVESPMAICSNNVTVDGFTLSGATNAGGFFSGIWTNPGYCGADGGYTIINNIIENNVQGIFPNGTINPTRIQYNLIRNNNNPGPASGNGIYSEFNATNMLIDSNVFAGPHANTSIGFFGTQSALTISNNEIENRIFLVNTTSSSITGNTSIGSARVTGVIRLYSGNSGITIDGNVIRNSAGRAIRVDGPDTGGGSNSGIVATDNCLEGNAIAGLEVSTGGYAGSLNAENNWWGDAAGPNYNGGGPGPAAADDIVDPDGVVDFDPWLTMSNCVPPPVPAGTPVTLAILGFLLLATLSYRVYRR